MPASCFFIAHRGASKYAPENTMASFKLAKVLGATWIECDVTLSKDDRPVIIHDDTLDRTTNGHGQVSDKTLAEMESLDAGSWFDKKYQYERIPTLETLLEFVSQSGLFLNLEIKEVAIDKVERLVDKVLGLLSQYDLQKNILISSFQMDVIVYLDSLKFNYPKALLVNKLSDTLLSQALLYHCEQINLSNRHVNSYWVERCHAQGLKIGVYTVNESKRYQDLQDLGVDAIFSDDLAIQSKLFLL